MAGAQSVATLSLYCLCKQEIICNQTVPHTMSVAMSAMVVYIKIQEVMTVKTSLPGPNSKVCLPTECTFSLMFISIVYPLLQMSTICSSVP